MGEIEFNYADVAEMEAEMAKDGEGQYGEPPYKLPSGTGLPSSPQYYVTRGCALPVLAVAVLLTAYSIAVATRR